MLSIDKCFSKLLVFSCLHEVLQAMHAVLLASFLVKLKCTLDRFCLLSRLSDAITPSTPWLLFVLNASSDNQKPLFIMRK